MRGALNALNETELKKKNRRAEKISSHGLNGNSRKHRVYKNIVIKLPSTKSPKNIHGYY
jgi:hypothetical protein